mgnify:CR=1 FL=1
MDDPQPPVGPDPSRSGRLSREEATAILELADSALSAGEFADAAVRYGRVIGFDDAPITAAALLGLGEARYRMGDDDSAVASWEAATKVGETPSTYPAWRNVAAARVRSGDLQGAIDAYRQADRRAPPQDKAEIATLLAAFELVTVLVATVVPSLAQPLFIGTLLVLYALGLAWWWRSR